jgi:hypothetical protein
MGNPVNALIILVYNLFVIQIVAAAVTEPLITVLSARLGRDRQRPWPNKINRAATNR